MRTFGTAVLGRGGEWHLDVEPHVALRLKRVFGGVHRGSVGTIRLSDTEDNAAELLWFMERFPLEVTPREHLEERAQRAKVREDEIERLLSGKANPPAVELALPAREYQRVAAAMVLTSGGLLLADDVGIGKTVSAICTFRKETLPALVVTLTHLPRQWENEINRFTPALSVHILKSGKPYDLRFTRKPPKGQPQLFEPAIPDVVICNYHKLAGWADVLRQFVKTVVFDECQELRHSGSQKYAAAKQIARAATVRMGLSATPIYNYGEEIFHVLSVLKPGALGTYGEFMTEWCTGNEGKARIQEPKAFGSYARAAGLMLRRTRHDVGRELPALTKVPHEIDADEDALSKVESSASELARMILSKNEARGAQWRASEEFSMLLRQATGVAKAPFVADFVRLLVESGESVVLYGWHREVYSIWLERLKDLGPVLYTGSESSAQKAASAEKFIKGETKVIVISLRAGAGLDGLQKACRTVVFGELDWSPGVHEQCIGRIYRDGQPDPVVAYFLIASTGADPVISEVLGLKKQQIEGIRDPNAALLEAADTDADRLKRLARAYLRDRGAFSREAEETESMEVRS